MSAFRRPSPDAIRAAFGCSLGVARLIRSAMHDIDGSRRACDVISAILTADRESGAASGFLSDRTRVMTHGAERIVYMGGHSLTYVNTGDGYAPTVYHDDRDGHWRVGAWADEVERRPSAFRDASAG